LPGVAICSSFPAGKSCRRRRPARPAAVPAGHAACEPGPPFERAERQEEVDAYGLEGSAATTAPHAPPKMIPPPPA